MTLNANTFLPFLKTIRDEDKQENSSPTCSKNREVIIEVTDTYLTGKENALKFMKRTIWIIIFWFC